MAEIKSIASVGIADVAGVGLVAIFWFYMATMLDTEQYGEIHYFLGIAGLAYAISLIGTQNTLIVSVAKKFKTIPTLSFITLIGLPILLIESLLWFWVLGATLGIFFGPVQSASRSLMVRLVPPGEEAGMFGLYALSGKITSFVGPWLVGLLVLTYDSQRLALSIVIPFLIIGGLILLTVKNPSQE